MCFVVGQQLYHAKNRNQALSRAQLQRKRSSDTGDDTAILKMNVATTAPFTILHNIFRQTILP